MIKHTPGPWRTEIMREGPHGGYLSEIIGADGASVCAYVHDEADALVAAAAPVLLEAANDVAAHMRCCDFLPDAHKLDEWASILEAAIAKARGE